jgi:hypothetical protein
MEAVLDDPAEVTRDVGQDHAEALRAVERPRPGSARRLRLPALVGVPGKV